MKMYLEQWITILKVWFFSQSLVDQNFPDKTEEDFQRFPSGGDLLNSTSSCCYPLQRQQIFWDIDIYDVCSNDSKYENGIMTMVF